MSNEIAKKEKPVDVLKSIIAAPSIEAQFKNALGEHKDTFVASLIDLYVNEKQLQTCDAKSVVLEALRAATLRLPLNRALGFAYIIVFNNSVKNPDGSWSKVPTPTFVPGYKGYIQLAMRTGQYRTINADFVYEGELRKVDKLKGEVAFDGEKKSDKIVGYFCYFELLNGFSKTLYVSIEEMAAYALRYSPSFKGRNKPTAEALIAAAQSGAVSSQVGWQGNFNDMGLKTVIRRLLSKYGYLSVEMQSAMDKDVEDAGNSRDETIAEHGNSKTIIAEAVEYEHIDTETGEITQGQAPAEQNTDAAPNY
ncbi:recombinase RecT [Hoylesella loescheii]|uniref:Recombinase, phage RecT family n=1 Tax=Hoylesella loescheii DSM 19665 = JCM 12249 = ATCC 15930 TaxID=1122985 RepID=A0A069QGE3_HOYLO|nr:recombinase RecT [Hoylesella loescheii]KDR51727.1 recombinase, phage RecT family [Hoylesella loescheii DSM 19665 = JCM 12249 = ATCC 15930]